MHKLHIIQRPDGTLLIIGVANPHMPADVLERTRRSLISQFGGGDRVIVVPYATQVQVHSHTLWESVRGWWHSRQLTAKTIEHL